MSDVAIVGCPGYSPNGVYDAVLEAFSLMGGAQSLAKAGQTVLLKPNLLQSSKPEEAIVTHPYVVGAVARILKDHGVKVLIADSPGGPFTRFHLERTYRKTGYQNVAIDTGATLNFNTGTEQVSNPDGKLIKRFDILSSALAVDAVINLPKLKNHAFMRLTGAVKNIFGLVPGLVKAGYHAKLVTADNFAEMLLDFLLMVKPTFTIMDAIVGMEGDGPAAGKPKHIGALIVSKDSIAVDSVAASIVNVKAADVPVLYHASQRGIPSASLSNINILGKALEEVRVKNFIPPTGVERDMSRIPAPIRQFVANSLVVQADVNKSTCDGCGDCYTMCPVDAITIKNKKASINKNLCIRCYCCHEICPQKAVTLKPSMISRLVNLANRKF